MADRSSSKNPRKISSFLGSPRFFNGVLVKTLSDTETVATSPTSILDTKNSTCFMNPFGFDTHLFKASPPSSEISTHSCRKQEPEAIGLALIDSIIEEKNDGNTFSKPINRLSVLGSKLKIQIPTANPSSSPSPPPLASPPADFGIKTRNSQLLSPICGTPDKNLTRQLSLKEMELCEDYTCVIVHGPNPRTTHIFDDCIVESSCGDCLKSSCLQKTECDLEISVSTSSPSANFFSFCHSCKPGLDRGQDFSLNRK